MLYSNYEIHTNVSGITDVVTKLRTFAVAAGWTESDFRSGERYEQKTAPYGFQGTADPYYSFFHLSSPGWGGAQNLIFQFMSHNYQYSGWYYPRSGVDGHDTTDYALCMGIVKNTTYAATGSNRAPWHQDPDNTFEAASTYQHATGGIRIAHDTVIPKMYLFGDDKFIWMTVTHDNFYHQHFFFGSVVPLDATMPINGNLAFRGFSFVTGNSATQSYPWEAYKTFSAPYTTKPYASFAYFSQPSVSEQSMGKLIWGDEHLGPVYENHYWTKGVTMSGSELSYPNFEDLKISRTLGGRYHLMKTVYSALRPADSFIQPFATTPFYSCNCVGETPGTILEYGNDKFMILPDGTLESNRWFAIRIQ